MLRVSYFSPVFSGEKFLVFENEEETEGLIDMTKRRKKEKAQKATP
jgi:hypothetical protein